MFLLTKVTSVALWLSFWGKACHLSKYYMLMHVAFLVAQLVKNLPAMQKTWVQFLGWEDPLEEGVATHSSILAWRIPMNKVYSPWG